MTYSLSSNGFHTLMDYGFDGLAAFEAVIVASPYKSLAQAIASLTLFSHPETVRQTGCGPVIRVIRNFAKRGEIVEIDGQLVAMDDNKAPTDVFLWCNDIRRRPREVQFNHVYADSQDPESYACLANLCITPSFLAKLTDTNIHIRTLLQYRAFDLYGWHPRSVEKPREPNGYSDLNWAPCLPPVENVGACFEVYMRKRPRDRTTLFARQMGTVFNFKVSSA